MAAVNPVELLDRHVLLFNQGVRDGDFGPMLAGFTDDAEMVFQGVPAGPFRGREAIAAEYAARPPDDEIQVLDVSAGAHRLVAGYAWRAAGGRRAGDLIIEWRGERISRLKVTFDPPTGA